MKTGHMTHLIASGRTLIARHGGGRAMIRLLVCSVAALTVAGCTASAETGGSPQIDQGQYHHQTPGHKTHHKTVRADRPSRTTVRLLASSSSIRAGGTMVISGSVAPRRADQVVYLQRRVATYTWLSVQHQRLNDRSRFHFTVTGSRAGAFAYRIREPRLRHRFRSAVSGIVHVRVRAVVHHVAPIAAAPPSRSCTPGYSPCVPVASDVDCAGGSGNGPAYVEGPVYVTGSDPYGLDSDGDGVGCES